MKALDNIVGHLSLKNQALMTGYIKEVEEALEKARPGDFWKDPEKKAKTREKMREAWAKRPQIRMKVTWPSGDSAHFDNYLDIGNIVCYAPHTVRCMVSRGKGKATFHRKGLIIVERV